AQAIAMLAYGVDLGDVDRRRDGGAAPLGDVDRRQVGGAAPLGDLDRCAPVDMVTGPGNIWVTAAKRVLKGQIGIDSEAGPTEVAVLADDSADPAHVAADLISQAEHDTLAAAVLVTTSAVLAEQVEREIEEQLARTKHVERISEALTGPQSGIVLVDDIDQGLRVVDAYAAEHLEIHTRDAREVALRVRNAGAIFVGTHAPVSLGDYCAGSNHVLPTGGSAAHSSGLSVQTFLRGVHIIDYDADALAGVADHVVALAIAEDLPGHAAAITVRMPD
ncbi:MAG: histidinol dehydrogenase, partial [Candidatus Nanopelagicales bacterium]